MAEFTDVQTLRNGHDGGQTLAWSELHLKVVAGPDKGLEASFTKRAVVVGKAPECDFVVTDPSVSGRHLELAVEPAGLFVRDLGSTNGVRMDMALLREAVLLGPSTITLGKTTLAVTTGETKVLLPLSAHFRFGALLGRSPIMRGVFATLEQAARTKSTVLLRGESGTGKELAARALHDESPRRSGPYVVVDCGSIPASLIESHLFGHMRGAFTGATESREGAFEQAHQGTLLLDEVGELPLEHQPRLLRVLESRTVQRVGGSTAVPVDVRVVAATHRDLAKMVAAGTFRQDLYYRLAVVLVELPPLRQRREELRELVEHFALQLGANPAQVITPALLQLLEAHDWPGNVRELRNVVERWVAVPDRSGEFYLGAAPHAPEEQGAGAPATAGLDQPYHGAKAALVDRFERAYLEHLLARCGGNVSEAARRSGLARQSLYRMLEKHGLAQS